MGVSHCLFLLAFAGVAVAFSGQYIPKSFYVIDENGQKSDVVYIRSRRDLKIPLLRYRRGGGNGAYASSSAQASSSSNSGGGSGGGGGGGGNYADYIPDIGSHLANFANNFPDEFGGGGGGAGARSFASSSSSSYSGGSGGGGGGGSGYGNSGHAGGLGAGNHAGYDGPILFSRFGEDKGDGVQVSGSAQGPKAAFSSSSSSSDGNGNVKYSVQSGKY